DRGADTARRHRQGSVRQGHRRRRAHPAWRASGARRRDRGAAHPGSRPGYLLRRPQARGRGRGLVATGECHPQPRACCRATLPRRANPRRRAPRAALAHARSRPICAGNGNAVALRRQRRNGRALRRRRHARDCGTRSRRLRANRRRACRSLRRPADPRRALTPGALFGPPKVAQVESRFAGLAAAGPPLMRRILILGVNGFIGHHFSQRVIAATDWEIYGMDMQTDRITDLLAEKRFHFFEGDITINREWIEYHIKKCDTVLPLVAIATPATYVREPLRVFELDFEANLPIVRACVRYRKRVVFPSTSEVYGMCRDDEFDPEVSELVLGPIAKPRWIYACAKQLMDRVIHAYGMQEGLDYTLFRPFNW